jgi:hypothetical protein
MEQFYQTITSFPVQLFTANNYFTTFLPVDTPDYAKTQHLAAELPQRGAVFVMDGAQT